jgi:hypothetical protein
MGPVSLSSRSTLRDVHPRFPDTLTWSCGDLARHVASHVEPGFTVSVEGSTSALFAAAAAVWDTSRWGVFAGLPNAGLLAARQAGIPLDRTTVVPDLGAEPLRVLAALVDSYGVVVIGPLALTFADRRRIEARVRHRHAHLIVGGPWPGARLAIEVAQVVRDGIAHGHGTLGAASMVASMRSRVHELWGRAAG